MSSFNDYQESVITSWVDMNHGVELPVECRDVFAEDVRCETNGDLVDCFVEYLEQQNFSEELEENPGAITNLEPKFDVFADDHLFAVGEE